MKVIVASFQYEACGKSKIAPERGDFEYAQGKEIFEKLEIDDIFADNGIETVPVIYANALPGGICPNNLYESFAAEILQAVRVQKDADAIMLVCHGSSEIEAIGSGELDLVTRIRGIVGSKPLLAISFDLHANIDERLIKQVDIVCGYKTAPHTDQTATHRATAKILTEALTGGYRPVVSVRKVPMLLTGDTMLTSEEPLRSLIAETNKAERERVFRVSLFFSHMWVDAPNTCACVTVTAATKEIGEQVADIFAVKFWNTRRQYRFNVPVGSVEQCVKAALAEKSGRIFLTDSGDNTTAGAEGDNTDILEEFLKRDAAGKKICISGITSPHVVCCARTKKIGDKIAIRLSEKLAEGKIVNFGKILGWAKDIIGDSVTLDFDGIKVIYTDKRSAFISEANFRCANESLSDYDIVAVKLGYLFSELQPYCDKQYFVLSDGASCVDIRRLNLKRIPRPMYPLDEFDWKIN